MKHTIFCLGICTIALTAVPAFVPVAVAQQGIKLPSLDEYCKLKAITARETIVYVDGNSVPTIQAATELSNTISRKIGLGPRERVRIFYVNSNDGAKEIFSKCWPELTAEEFKARDNPDSWWGKLKQVFDQSSEAKLGDTKDFFRVGIQSAIAPHLSVKSGKVDFVRVLNSEKDRLPAGKPYTILIYSKMASDLIGDQQSAAGPATNDAERIERLFKDYPVALNGADIFVWGVAGSEQIPLRVSERLWRAFFQKGFGKLRSFGSELPIFSATSVSTPITLTGSWKSSEGDGKAGAVISSTPSGSLVSSWLSIQSYTKAYAIPLEGSYICKSPKECSLGAQVAVDVPTLADRPFFGVNDVVEMAGDPGVQMTGKIRPPGMAKFPGGRPVEYQLNLHAQ